MSHWSLIVFAALLSACAPNVKDSRAEGSFEIPAGTTEVRVELEKGQVVILPAEDGKVSYEALVRRGTTKAQDLVLLDSVVAELKVEPGEPGQLNLVGPKVPTELAERDFGAAVVLRISMRVPEQLDVRLRTGRGSLSVRERSGSVNLSTDSGKIELLGIKGKAETFTGNGHHLISRQLGSVDLRSESGNVVAYFDAIGPEGISI